MKNGSEKKVPEHGEGPEPVLTLKDVVDILEVIDSMDSKELRLETGDLKLNVIKG